MQKIIEAEKASLGKVIVTFNYRYAPIHTKIKELILEGKLGKITSIDLNWYLDTHHGSSYFKRWNRYRDISGGLSIHKCTHHFDLVNWWINQTPVEAFAYGDLHYYGANGELNPAEDTDGRYCGTCSYTEECAYYARWNRRQKVVNVPDDHLAHLKPKIRNTHIQTIVQTDVFLMEILRLKIRIVQQLNIAKVLYLAIQLIFPFRMKATV